MFDVPDACSGIEHMCARRSCAPLMPESGDVWVWRIAPPAASGGGLAGRCGSVRRSETDDRVDFYSIGAHLTRQNPPNEQSALHTFRKDRHCDASGHGARHFKWGRASDRAALIEGNLKDRVLRFDPRGLDRGTAIPVASWSISDEARNDAEL